MSVRQKILITVLRLDNLVREDAKKLAKKLLKQKFMSNRDRQKSKVLLANTRRKVLLRHAYMNSEPELCQ
tara:strand:+ start:680 stop:889 length:210 start_codon:yes stop_codon:yes gene_type:complete